MELREFVSLRRAYNLVRQDLDSSERVTFAEFAIACHLSLAGEPIRTSLISDYQNSLRPTMTHRTKRLEAKGLIERTRGGEDLRIIGCTITDKGNEFVESLCEKTAQYLQDDELLAQVSPERLASYVDAAGEVYFQSSELVLLAIGLLNKKGCSIGEIVESIGMLQPTVSMAVTTLIKEDLAVRGDKNTSMRNITLTRKGRRRHTKYRRMVEELLVSEEKD